MGLVILTLALVIEVGLAVYSIRTRSAQRRVRTVARVAQLVGFGLAVGLGLIDWGPVYYVLAGVLMVSAVVAVLAELRAKPPRFRTARTFWAAVAMGLLFLLTALPPIVFPGHDPIPTTGEWGVATMTRTLTDADRPDPVVDTGEPRRLTVSLWYPAEMVAPAPLIVFSHGGTGVRSSNESLFNELASHGYVVASIDHTYHSLFTVDETGSRTWIDSAFLRELRDEDASADPVRSLALYRKWLAVRTDDINFVIDRAVSGELGLNVDARRIGVIGHSLGGSAALAVGRQRQDVGAVIALEAPFLGDIEEVVAGEFAWTPAAYPVPVLNVYSDAAWGHLDEWPQYARNAELLANPDATVRNLHLEGVGHFGLTDLALTSPILTRLFDGPATADARSVFTQLNRVSVEFLDTHLR